jgi:MtrB/PioB family decaheme-associated outer membrane protein
MTKPTFKLTALSAALAGTWGLACAQTDADLAALTKPQSEASAGVGFWSDDRPRLGTYDGMPTKGAYGLFDAFINRRDDATGTWLRLDARNLGLETRELRAEWLRQGNMGAFLEYSRTPRDEPYTVFTATQGIGTATQRTPATQPVPLGEVHLGTVRDAIGLGFSKIVGGGFDFRFNFKSEDKTGDRIWGRGGAPEFAAEPIDSNTKQLEAVLGYTSKAFQVQGGYYGSWYSNSIKGVDTALTNGLNPYFLSQPLDNQAHQLFANGGYNLSQATRATFKVAYTKATQNEPIPVGPGVLTFAGAPTNLNGQIDTTLLQAGLSSRVSSAFSWLASLRYHDSDEKTPQVRVVQTGAAATPCPTCVDNTPLHLTTTTGKVEGTYRLQPALSLTGGLDHTKQERRVPFGNTDPGGAFDAQRYVPWRSEMDETTLRLELRRSLSETLNGRIAFAHSRRDGSSFTTTNEPESDMINPIHIADRDRNKVKLVVDWAPLQAVTLAFNVEYAKDEYGHDDARPFGLRDGSAAVYSLDASYALSENWALSAWVTRDEMKATQLGQRDARDNAGDAVKDARLEDVGNTLGAALRGTLMPRLKVGAEFLYSRNVNRYPETVTLTGPGAVYPSVPPVFATGPLRDITNTLTRLKLNAVYALRKNADVRVDYVHERWQTDDWTWFFADGSPFTYGTTTDGTQLAQPSSQSADFIGVRFIYKFQ